MKRFLLFIFLLSFFVINLAVYLEVPAPIGTVIVPLQADGGLGNQLFRYAAGYTLAKKTNSRLYVIVRRGKGERKLEHPFDGRLAIAKFNVDPKAFQYRNIANKFFAVKEVVKEYNFFELANKPNRKVLFIDDDFESEIFFKEYKNEILNIFTPKADLSHLSLLFDELAEKDSVCMHVRRGDMINDANVYHYKIDIDYQKIAMKLIKEKIDNPRFYVFSDSIEEAKRELEGEKNLTFIHKKAFEDFILMSRCANNIVANSTYSWWAAYLNKLEDRLVFAPYPRYSSRYFAKLKEDEYKKRKRSFDDKYHYPEEWIKVNYETK